MQRHELIGWWKQAARRQARQATQDRTAAQGAQAKQVAGPGAWLFVSHAGRYVSSPSPDRISTFSWKSRLLSSKACRRSGHSGHSRAGIRQQHKETGVSKLVGGSPSVANGVAKGWLQWHISQWAPSPTLQLREWFMKKL